jgi:exodeoxyribonuclease V alpha subunit
MVNDSGSLLVRVSRVRVQSDASGVIFYGQQVSPDGEISDLEEDLTVRLHQHATAGVKVCKGQRWRVEGQVRRREFVTASGFKRREKTVDVPRGCAELVKPSGSHIKDYLMRHSDLPGIREATSDLLWDRFGQGLYDVLDQGDYQALVDVIHPDKAAMLIEVWQRENLSQTIQWLAKHDVNPKVARRLVQIHGTESRQRVEEDCYRLLSYAARWEEVDGLAVELGVAPDDPRRLSAACEQVIYGQFTEGHTVVPKKTLVQGLRALLKREGSESSAIVQAAKMHAEASGRVLFDSSGNAYGIGLWAPVRTCWVLAGFKMLRGLRQHCRDADAGDAGACRFRLRREPVRGSSCPRSERSRRGPASGPAGLRSGWRRR